MQLFPYQKDLVQNIKAEIQKGFRRICVVLSTGGGKTATFSFIAAAALAKKMASTTDLSVDKSVLILTHRTELLTQSHGTLSRFGVTAGIIKAGFTPNRMAGVQVASVSTLVARLPKHREKYDIIIIDECHHATAPTYKKILEHFNPGLVLGFTATPERADGTGLADVFDSMVIGPPLRELIRMGRLCRPVTIRPETELDVSEVRIKGKDFDEKELEKVVNTKSITGDVVSHYLKFGNNMPGCAFCVSVKHAETVAAAFNDAGIPSAAVYGDMKPGERKEILKGLEDGSVKIITSCDLISEGFDLPAIGVAILLRPTMSLGLYIQQVGRALRVYPGKEKAIVLDHAGNYFRHGLITQNFKWSLQGREKKQKKSDPQEVEIKTRQCSECFAVYEPAPKCPECGCGSKPQPRQIKTKSGRLIVVPDDLDLYLIGDIPDDYAGTPSQWAEEKLSQERQERQKEAAKLEKQRQKTEAEIRKKQIQRERNAARTIDKLLEFCKKWGYPDSYAYQIERARKFKNDEYIKSMT